MYVERIKRSGKGKQYYSYLLRESYRENGKVCKRTIANISHLPAAEIEAVQQALSHKSAGVQPHDIRQVTGPIVGTLLVVAELCKRVGIVDALGGTSRKAALVVWLIFARVVEQGSRLSSTRLANRHATSLIGLNKFDENDLYEALDWLADRQREVEKKLFDGLNLGNQLFLYDVTSVYFEGSQNELAWWGYNRDGKKGKRQLVFGMVTDIDGEPIAVEVFQGNTADSATFLQLIKEFGARFGVQKVTFVGDRGMIKSFGIKALREHGFTYITAITKPQVKKLLKTGVIQLSFFDEQVQEVEHRQSRYILRRNPVRTAEVRAARSSKLETLRSFAAKQTQYLAQHAKASADVAMLKVRQLATKLQIGQLIAVTERERKLTVEVLSDKWEEAEMLDGCYVIKTDLTREEADKQTVHQRYKDLAKVERGFRTMKTGCLEIRPIWLRRLKRTKAHVFVCMLAYKVQRQLERLCEEGETVSDIVQELNRIARVDLVLPGSTLPSIPAPPPRAAELLERLNLRLPYLSLSLNR